METRATLLRELFDAAVAASSAANCVPAALPTVPAGKTVVLGAGKAAAAMARAVEDHWQGPLEGLVVTRYDHGADCDRIEVVEAAHPVPDEAGQVAARRLVDMAESLGPDDLALCLISGGGSSLLSLPAPGVSLDDKRQVTRGLLGCGASIHEINVVRKHLSAIKGGRLAAACHPSRVVTLVISDVPGDDPSIIASGPTVTDPSTFAQARAVIERSGIAVPPTVAAHLGEAATETPKPGDPAFASDELHMVATAQGALEAAAATAERSGYRTLMLGERIEGEAREVAKVMAGIAQQVRHWNQPLRPPCILISGGETTVTVKGQGRGGRNAEFLLGLAIALDGARRIWALACDTDGIDGIEDNAGALITPDTLARAARAGLDPQAMLEDNDAYGFFAALGDLVMTGPTRTNVNDFRAILIER